jgi:hypothetical protein
MMSTGSIIEGAFRLIREHPAAVAVWGLIYTVAAAGMALAMLPLLQAQAGGAVSPLAMVGRMLLLQVAFFILFVILMTAAQRAVLRPRESGFAFLRLGMDELRMLALSVILGILFYVGFLIVLVIVVMLVAGAGAAAGAGVAGAAAIIGVIAAVAAMAWPATRLSLAFPLTLVRGKIIIGESWRRTKGRFWTLFAAYLAIFLMIFLLSILVGLVTSGSYIADMVQNMGNPAGMQQAMRAEVARQTGGVNAMMVVGWILSGVVGALYVALGSGAVATAARELTEDEDEIAETFA